MSILTGFQTPIPASDNELATQTLNEEALYRFPSFSANDAVTLGLSLRKRFRASRRHARGRGLVISIQTIAGHTLFACTVGDLGGTSGVGDVSLDSWACLEGMINVVRRTGHSSFYVEKSLGARDASVGRGQGQLPAAGTNAAIVQREFLQGGAFPVWLENAPCCPIAIVGCYSGSGQDDHNMVVAALRDYMNKLVRGAGVPPPQGSSSATIPPGGAMPVPHVYEREREPSSETPSEFDSEPAVPIPVPGSAVEAVSTVRSADKTPTLSCDRY